MLKVILDDWFDVSKIQDKNRMNYFVLCEYYNEPLTFKCKHYKKLSKKFKKEIDKETK